MIGLNCRTKIKWRDSQSLSIKEGVIVKVIRNYCTDGTEVFHYDAIGSDTGTYCGIEDKDIDFVNVNGWWIDYKQIKLASGYHRRSVRYSWEEDKVIRDYIDNDVKVTKELCLKRSMDPKQVIFNGPATIVLWKDGTKTIVKRREGEPDDKEKAVMYCILKKACGNKATMDKYLKLFLKEESNDEEKKD